MNTLCPVASSLNEVDLDDQPKTIGESLLWLLKSKKFCDVVFTFPNLPDRIQAHEFCLKARSPVFEQIFGMRESGNAGANEIEISECTPERFQEFLEFIYTDNLEVDIVGALDLLPLAQKYKIQPLTSKCEALLRTYIHVKDAVKVFEGARRLGRQKLMDRAAIIMVESFRSLGREGALMNAEEETVIYLLKRDDLSFDEVGLFQIILEWGRKQAGSSTDEQLLNSKLKNLITKIRYTNMAPNEFTKFVVPTGMLSTEEVISVYSYLCGDEATRTALEIKFNTTPRQMVEWVRVQDFLDFYIGNIGNLPVMDVYPAISMQSISFKVERDPSATKVWSDCLKEKEAIAAIDFEWPEISSDDSEHLMLNFIVTLREYTGPVTEGNFTTRFQTKLLNCKRHLRTSTYVVPPVELISGRTYSVIIEDFSIADLGHDFPSSAQVYRGLAFKDTNHEASVDLEDVRLTVKEIHRNTEYHNGTKFPDGSHQLALIRGVTIALVTPSSLIKCPFGCNS